jgi:hypothetical protein
MMDSFSFWGHCLPRVVVVDDEGAKRNGSVDDPEERKRALLSLVFAYKGGQEDAGVASGDDDDGFVCFNMFAVSLLLYEEEAGPRFDCDSHDEFLNEDVGMLLFVSCGSCCR